MDMDLGDLFGRSNGVQQARGLSRRGEFEIDLGDLFTSDAAHEAPDVGPGASENAASDGSSGDGDPAAAAEAGGSQDAAAEGEPAPGSIQPDVEADGDAAKFNQATDSTTIDVAKMCALERRRSLPTKNLQRRQGAMCFSSVEIPELADLNDFTGKVAPAKKALQTSKLMFLHEINMKAFQKLRDSVTSAPPLEAGELRYTTQQIDSMESTYLNGLNDYELEGQLAVAEDYATSAFGIDPEKLLDPNGARLVKPPESPDIDSGIRLPNDSPNLPDQSSERLDNTVNSAQLRTPTLIAGDVNINSALAKRYQEATDTWAQTETTWQAKVRSAEKALENRAGMKPGEMEGILKNVGQDGVDVPLADQKAPMQIKVQGDSIIVKGLPTPKAGKILLAAALPAAVVGGAIAQVVSDNST